MPSFEVAHGNLRLPPVLTNFFTKTCSVLGIQKILTKGQDSDGVETEEQGYVNPSQIKKFDSRWDDVVFTGKGIIETEYRKPMPLWEFRDKFESNWKKDRDTGESHLFLTFRRESFNGMRYPTRLVPRLTSARANPKNKYHWLYCMHFCRYIRKCKVISEMQPVTLLEGKDLEDH